MNNTGHGAALVLEYRNCYPLPTWLSLLCSKPYHIYLKAQESLKMCAPALFNLSTYGFSSFLESAMNSTNVFFLSFLPKIPSHPPYGLSSVLAMSKRIKNDRKMHHVVQPSKRLLYDMARHVPCKTPKKVHLISLMSVFFLLKTLLYVYKG
jgi:hypothetical protein